MRGGSRARARSAFPPARPAGWWAGAAAAGEGGGGSRVEETVVGGLGGEAADGGKADVAGRGREALFLEAAGILLHRGLGKPLAGGGRGIPGEKVRESAAVGPPRVGGGEGVGD